MTRRLDKMAAEGLRFDSFYMASPLGAGEAIEDDAAAAVVGPEFPRQRLPATPPTATALRQAVGATDPTTTASAA